MSVLSPWESIQVQEPTRVAFSLAQRKHDRPWQNLERSLFPGLHPRHHSTPIHHSKGEQSITFRNEQEKQTFWEEASTCSLLLLPHTQREVLGWLFCLLWLSLKFSNESWTRWKARVRSWEGSAQKPNFWESANPLVIFQEPPPHGLSLSVGFGGLCVCTYKGVFATVCGIYDNNLSGLPQCIHSK